ncbi:hypothetical protein RGQ29_030098 [Quercus rubra]|uniref:SET domain-containing protein n=1 Tax=Quercus rubra TaxID=3512 RepID=A0AAN7EGL8_QUERU|nr:hypothetical protein RGQ29_030098 [Quercus rubra]KAK4571526.1 hypothetical protein RGQ29_030098 [Quercus rubra]KAK4571527.1 hypothetical protein RGQ29_030098 [Quercus rubra]KAK4571528.1 hypothetical protein RGQ29_030098 [Quercus rubra]
MEMEMRAREDIEIGEDITPPIPPLSYALHHSFLHSHCYSCFSPLPLPLNSNYNNTKNHHHYYYCSPACTTTRVVSTEELHILQSHHYHPFSSDLRAALRFLQSHPYDRVAGLLTNCHKLLLQEDDEFAATIREGAKAIATATATDTASASAALCLVLTNGVEVQDYDGRNLGIAVYPQNFSWINHSCSPNASYRFFLSPPPPCCPNSTKLRILPQHTVLTKDDEVCQDNGPKIVVRSIKRIKQGEQVTVTYTNLLQPKQMRQSELWSRYRFICCCERCSASPPTNVDHTLQEISSANLDASSVSSDQNVCRDYAIRRLTDYIDDAITQYLSFGNPELCCEKLEILLTQGLLYGQLEGREVKSQPTIKLHPLHYLCLNAYTTLASAYKVRASDLLGLYSELDEHLLEALDLSRTSAAYSLLLAGATHHLFQFESSLIATVANFWISAGDSLLTLSRSPVGSEFAKWDLPIANPPLLKCICSKCSLMDNFKAILFHREAQNADFEDISSEFLDCVTIITQKVWSFLTHGCCYLRAFKDPIDFSWLGTSKYSSLRDVQPHLCSTAEGHGYTLQERMHIFQLGVHCLLYGGYLANICYGRHSHLTSQVQNILDCEECLISDSHESD